MSSRFVQTQFVPASEHAIQSNFCAGQSFPRMSTIAGSQVDVGLGTGKDCPIDSWLWETGPDESLPMLYKLGRLLQFAGLVILPVAIAGDMAGKVEFKESLTLSAL